MKTVTGSFSVYLGETPEEWYVVASDSQAEEMPTLAVFEGEGAEVAARKLAETLSQELNNRD